VDRKTRLNGDIKKIASGSLRVKLGQTTKSTSGRRVPGCAPGANASQKAPDHVSGNGERQERKVQLHPAHHNQETHSSIRADSTDSERNCALTESDGSANLNSTLGSLPGGAAGGNRAPRPS
jgi:hypothetical protein